MKSIIIVSNKKVSEIDKFGITEFTDFFGKLQENDKEIIVINNSVTETILTSAMSICNGITTPKILLFHGDFEGYNGIKNYVGTGIQTEETKVDRAEYQNLLDATDKFSVFDNVWDYFSKKNNKETQERAKTDFLYSIYNGNVITDKNTPATVTEKITGEEVKKAYEYFQNVENKFDNSETEHIKHLTILRDTLLSEY